MNLTDTHAERLRAGVDPAIILDDLRRLAETKLARAAAGDCLHFWLVHGDIETVAETRLLRWLRDTAGHTCLLTRGGNDWTEYVLDPAAFATLALMQRITVDHAPSWWRWTTDGTDPQARR